MKKGTLSIITSFLILTSLISYSQQEVLKVGKQYYPDSNPIIKQKLEDWQDIKFGLMMHWGPYSQWGIVESWSICPEDYTWNTPNRVAVDSTLSYNEYFTKYKKLKTTFNPEKFDPEKWADAAQYAGMKYLVFTTKHHDGFCMFDTKTTDYKITSSDCAFIDNPKSNISKVLFDAFRKKKFWIGAYFSMPDWNSNNYWWDRFPPIDRNVNYATDLHPERWDAFVKFTHNQIKELTTDYGKMDLLWMDGGWVRPYTTEDLNRTRDQNYKEHHLYGNPQNQDLKLDEMAKIARANQPDLLMIARGVSGPYQNYLTPEQEIPEEGLPYPWETCLTMGKKWAYKPDEIFKPTDELIETLVDVVSKGGNLLLNVGPAPDGTLPDAVYERLKEIGNWMKTNSTAIYNTRKNNHYSETKNIRYTKSKDGKTAYVFLFDFPEKSFELTHLPFKTISKITILGAADKDGIIYKTTPQGFQITLDKKLKSASSHVWVLKIEN